VVSWPAADFPWLGGGNYTETSPATRRYNCIAWGAGNDARWWWPDARNIGYWPPNIPREETLDAFERAYALQGYAPCSNGDLEPGVEKVALYGLRVGTDIVPRHAARQLENGWWTSKLGVCEDIEHDTPDALIGPGYGAPVRFLRRPRS
jgi:hypothetical protein